MKTTTTDQTITLPNIIISTITITITIQKCPWQTQGSATTLIMIPSGALAKPETLSTGLNTVPLSHLPTNGRLTSIQKSIKCITTTVSIIPPWPKSNLKYRKKTKIMIPPHPSSLKFLKLFTRATLKTLLIKWVDWTSSINWRGESLHRSENR